MNPSVCEWPVDYGQCGDCVDSMASLSATGVALFEEMATEYLWRWTHKQFGLCQATIRPCRQDCFEGLSTYGVARGTSTPFQPTLISGRWFNLGCGGGCGDRCGCISGSTLVFETPVYDVLHVEINGATLDPSAYRVDNYRRLVRQDGNLWPFCQNLSSPLGATDTWAVTVRLGAPVPVGGQVAAGKLTAELAKAACGDTGCQLPQRWQTITRQGVTISAAIDLFQGLDEGKTGIWLIDSWVASVIKPGTSSGFAIASPDYHGAGRQTTP